MFWKKTLGTGNSGPKTTDVLKENSGNKKFRPTGRARSAWTPSFETTDLLKENSGNKKFRPENHKSFERKLWEQEVQTGRSAVYYGPEFRHRQTDLVNLYIRYGLCYVGLPREIVFNDLKSHVTFTLPGSNTIINCISFRNFISSHFMNFHGWTSIPLG